MIGEQLGDYLITKSLGKGGFGSVWEAKSETDETVALKILNPQVLENEKVVRKFFHEAMILAKLDHPHICKLLEFFPDGGNYAIVMEYVPGIELKDLLKQKGKLPIPQAFGLAKQTLKAFQYAHENGILHRDIKPANIMISNEGMTKIMDFGIAKMSSTASHDTAASMLSVHYVPPERFDKSSEIDTRSDIYSLALVFYEMFTGRRPFTATETSQIMFSHLNEIPESPINLAPEIPPQVSDAISKALEKSPDDRFNDFQEFSDAMGTLDDEDFDDETCIMDDDLTQIFEEAKLAEDLPETVITEDELEEEIEGKKKGKFLLIASILISLTIAGVVGGYFTLYKSSSGISDQEPTTIVEKAQTNSKGFEDVIHPGDGSTMILIPASEFMMGSEDYEAEKPVQKIMLSNYYIDKYLVTNAQFSKFVEQTGYVTDAEKEESGMVRIGRRWKKLPEANWKTPDGLASIDDKDNYPVSQISYNDALSYCKWARKDLPTEAQWEKVARGPEGNLYPWGNTDPNETTANFDNVIESVSAVDSYEKGQSFYGAFDMAGNVYQWCKDWYETGERTTKDPTGPETGTEHVVKGGSFSEGMESIRSSNRDRYEPNYSMFIFGFRCACEY